MFRKYMAFLMLLGLFCILTACGDSKKTPMPSRDLTPDEITKAFIEFGNYAKNLQQTTGVAYRRIQEQLRQSPVTPEGFPTAFDAAFVENLLAELQNQAPITVWNWQDVNGVIQFSTMTQMVGQRGEADDIVEVAYQNNAVYASNNIVQRAETQKALVIVVPVMYNGYALGSFVGVVSPLKDLGELLKPYIDLPRGLVLMNLQGGIIFSDNPEEIGYNYLTADIYKPYGDLLMSVNKMRSQESGTTRYYYFITPTRFKDWYDVQWGTVQYFSHNWRLAFRTPTSLDQSVY